MPRKLNLTIAAAAICLLFCLLAAITTAGTAPPQPLPSDNLSVEHRLDVAPSQLLDRNPAYADTVVIELPITIAVESEKQSNETQGWGESTVTVTNPRDVAVATKIALKYKPFRWDDGAWTPGAAKTAITIDDVVVAAHSTVRFTVPVKPERNAEKGFYQGIPELIAVRDWKESDVPVFASVIVVVPPEEILDLETDAPGGCADEIDNDGDGWIDLNDTDCPLPCNCSEGVRVYNREGDLVSVDCERGKCWTATALFSHSWGPPWVNVTRSCIQKGRDYPACDYCDELEYGGYMDWILPDRGTLLDFADSSFGSEGEFWSSRPANDTHAYCVRFGADEVALEAKTKGLRVRCVRG